MCSVTGVVYPKNISLKGLSSIEEKFISTLKKAEERGRDSFGISVITKDNRLVNEKHIGKPSQCIIKTNLKDPNISIVIANNRAEPTTEYIKNKTDLDIQPFDCNGWIVAHNGIIANDKDIIHSFHLENLINTKIDSAVIPALLFKKFGNKFDSVNIIEFLKNSIVGSYALAIANVNFPNKLILMTNYKPLYLARHQIYNYYIFASSDSYLKNKNLIDELYQKINVIQIPPYSAIYLDLDNNESNWNLINIKKEVKSKKALVVCSGGLDSTVVATKAVKDGYDVTLLHFKYSCRAENKEVKAIKDISKILKCDTLFVETDIFKTDILNSTLTNAKSKISFKEKSAEFAHEWVPARNLIMLSIAVGIAESNGFDVIMLGNNLEESGAYPDNEPEFIRKFNNVLPYATQLNKNVHIEMPVGNLMKHEIVKLGVDIGAPLNLTWSCYNAGEKHCGTCGPCVMRKTAFVINGFKEVIKYQDNLALDGTDVRT